ncbi:hypothetical protein [Idiomarina sp.]|uniref:hypothetical protein n=1 Tax=Idiomarina sp. TaxID=1874361 RepID=UPI002588A568|nr:hypothetical protein [Idiomarina sp.]|tara:strand:- start:851 stop:1051 length:201 start_codon:yes stop_codon:yes gene_type:complete
MRYYVLGIGQLDNGQIKRLVHQHGCIKTKGKPGVVSLGKQMTIQHAMLEAQKLYRDIEKCDQCALR